MGYPKLVEDAKCVMYLKFHENMPYGLFHATFVIIEQPLLDWFSPLIATARGGQQRNQFKPLLV